jgi:hypothetical protein
MKYYAFAFLFLVTISACHTSKLGEKRVSSKPYKTNSADRDGLSFAKAVIIEEKTEGKGVDAEYNWLAQHYPGYKTVSQRLTANNGSNYDIIKIKTRNGDEVDVYFDIDNFFGKW